MLLVWFRIRIYQDAQSSDCQNSRVSFGLEFSLIYTGQESLILQLINENYNDQARCKWISSSADLSASTYGDPVSRIRSQSQFHEDPNHIRSHRSEARTVLEEEEHEDQCQRSPCLRLQQLPYFLPENS